MDRQHCMRMIAGSSGWWPANAYATKAGRTDGRTDAGGHGNRIVRRFTTSMPLTRAHKANHAASNCCSRCNIMLPTAPTQAFPPPSHSLSRAAAINFARLTDTVTAYPSIDAVRLPAERRVVMPTADQQGSTAAAELLYVVTRGALSRGRGRKLGSTCLSSSLIHLRSATAGPFYSLSPHSQLHSSFYVPLLPKTAGS